MTNSVLISSNDLFNILLRLGVALLIGGVVGWNRQLAGKAAGLRTHMLVTVTAALLVLIPAQIQSAHPEEPISYVIQGVSTGVGFLGAGVIMRRSNPLELRETNRASHRSTVKGLTSASEIWVSAALGAGAGCGLWITSLFGTLLMLVILAVGKQLERFIPVHSEDGL